jgi:uncharacterized membrane protein YfcA
MVDLAKAEWILMIAGAFMLIAVLFAAVGRGGASGYLAVMALAGYEPAAMKPTALVLNIVIPLFWTVFFVRAGHFAWRLYLLVSGKDKLRSPQAWAVIKAGAGIGFLSGLIGLGGGIFLTPLILFWRWAGQKTAAAVSAPFILINFMAGLLGHFGSVERIAGGVAMAAGRSNGRRLFRLAVGQSSGAARTAAACAGDCVAAGRGETRRHLKRTDQNCVARDHANIFWNSERRACA